MGTTGLETAFAAVYTELVVPGRAAARARRREAQRRRGADGPARRRGSRSASRPALCLVDLDAEWQVGEAGYESRAENCCFAGRTLRGRVLATVAAGAVVYRERAFALSAA